ncbi:MAG: serine/threonine-protein kinase [Patescibacteria group bacterium]|nr:serine/threonine-protein kinase [Patescibacteria group bacterium]
MSNDPPRQRDLSAVEATLDAFGPADAPSVNLPSVDLPSVDLAEQSAQQRAEARIAVIEGSGPQLTQEMQGLLRRRLRLAAQVMAVGFAVFLPLHVALFLPGSLIGILFLAFHAVTTATLGALAVLLCRRCEVSLKQLWVYELIAFGLPTVFFLALQYLSVQRGALAGEFAFPIGSWLVMIYTYALFIPNTIRRASIIITLITLAPICLLLSQMAFQPAVGEAAPAADVIANILMLALAGVGSVFGVDTIGSLRREAFEAKQLGQYRLKKLIGAGGMGEVYLAEHNLLKRPCVIKLIQAEKAGDPRTLARFQREVQSTARLSHWNTIEIFDYGHTEDGTFYYVMEYLPGMSLMELVERFGPLPPERAIHLLAQTCDALTEAHAMGLIHRDIKPGNIFAAQRGGVYDVAKLLDFGLVKPLTDDEHSIQLTTEGAITGSPLFMSPEQATGDAQPDARSDMYSLGAVGYFLLTGRPPFEGDRPIKVIIAHAHHEVTPPSRHVAAIPHDLERVVLRCLEKEPSRRYQTAADLAESLRRCAAAGRWTFADAARWWRTPDAERGSCKIRPAN